MSTTLPPDADAADAVMRVLDRGPETPQRVSFLTGWNIQAVLRALDALKAEGRVTRAFDGGPNKAVWMVATKRWNDTRTA